MKFAVNVVTMDQRPAGARALHYLAALLEAMGHKVYVLPNSPLEDKEAIAVYPDAIQGNPWGVKRIVRYMCYYPHEYFGAGVCPKSELVICYHKMFSTAVQAQASNPIPEPITIPTIDPKLFYPETKNLLNLVYIGNKGHCSGTPHISRSITVTRESHSREQFSALMRKAYNFYSTDHDTVALVEAKLCGCKTWIAHSPTRFEPVDRPVDGMVMHPEKDLMLACRFTELVQEFFHLS